MKNTYRRNLRFEFEGETPAEKAATMFSSSTRPSRPMFATMLAASEPAKQDRTVGDLRFDESLSNVFSHCSCSEENLSGVLEKWGYSIPLQKNLSGILDEWGQKNLSVILDELGYSVPPEKNLSNILDEWGYSIPPEKNLSVILDEWGYSIPLQKNLSSALEEWGQKNLSGILEDWGYSIPLRKQLVDTELSDGACGKSVDRNRVLVYDDALSDYVEREVFQLHDFDDVSSDYHLSSELTGNLHVVCREILQDSNSKKYGEIKYVDLSAIGSEGSGGKGGLPGTFEIVYGLSNELSLINCALPVATKWFFYDDQSLTSLSGEYFITLKVDLYDDPPGISCQCENVQPWVFSDQRLSNIVYVPLYKMNDKTVLCDYKNNVHIQAFQNYS